MNVAQQLHDLQTLDLEAEDTERLLADTESQIGETDAVLAARQSLSDASSAAKALRTSIQELEWELDTCGRKLKDHSAKLYGGTVSNPKELASFAKDVELLSHHKSDFEDRILALLTQQEDADQALEAAETACQQAEAQWNAEQRDLKEQQAQLTAKLGQLAEQRGRLQEPLPADYLELYENLRRTKRGKAVARIEQNMCQGCRVTLPMREVQVARGSKSPVFCSSCGRMLLTR